MQRHRAQLSPPHGARAHLVAVDPPNEPLKRPCRHASRAVGSACTCATADVKPNVSVDGVWVKDNGRVGETDLS